MAPWMTVLDLFMRTLKANSAGCCKVLGANGGSETITNAGDYCIRKHTRLCAFARVCVCRVVATMRAYTVGS